MLDAQSVTYLSMLDTLEEGLHVPRRFALQQGDNRWKTKPVINLGVIKALKHFLCCGNDFEIC